MFDERKRTERIEECGKSKETGLSCGRRRGTVILSLLMVGM
jgi:hypothetical protein